MNLSEMEVDIRYVVTKESDDGTFELGDHISLQDNGDILCQEAAGWIDAENVSSAIKGMELEVDEMFYTKQMKKIKEILEKKIAEEIVGK